MFLLSVFSFTSIGLAFPNGVDARTRIKGYVKRSGKYVAPHFRTDKNKTKKDNWSTKGNRNPYTGKKGYKKLK